MWGSYVCVVLYIVLEVTSSLVPTGSLNVGGVKSFQLSNSGNGSRRRGPPAPRPIKTGEHTYASWMTDEKDMNVQISRKAARDFGLDDDDRGEGEGRGGDVGPPPDDALETLRSTASKMYDSIFFYGLDDMGSADKSRRTPKSKKRSPFFTNSELIGEELMESPSVSIDALRKTRSTPAPLSSSSASLSSQQQQLLRRTPARVDRGVAERLRFLEGEISFLKEELEIHEIAVEAGNAAELADYDVHKEELLNKLDVLNADFITLAARE